MKNRLPWLISFILVGVIFFQEKCSRSKADDLIADIANYKTEAETYRTKNGVLVATNEALVLENEKQLEAVLAKDDTIAELLKKKKEVKTVTVITNSTNIGNDTIRLRDTIPCDFEPIKAVRDSQHYYFEGTIAKDYFSIDSLSIPDIEKIVFGRNKGGLFKKGGWSVEVVHSNPLVNTSNIGAYTVKDKPKGRLLWMGIGFGAAVLVNRVVN